MSINQGKEAIEGHDILHRPTSLFHLALKIFIIKHQMVCLVLEK